MVRHFAATGVHRSPRFADVGFFAALQQIFPSSTVAQILLAAWAINSRTFGVGPAKKL